MRIHIIAIGGSVMHQLAIALKSLGHIVSGSDDEIYDPSLSRLKASELCPKEFGWFEENIDSGIDKVILGMHAKKDNPELNKALSLGIDVVSYPEFIYQQSISKKRVVVAGSHGKTTTTSMIMHVLKHAGIRFDYLVGAALKGFDNSVHLSDADIIVLEGDEYLSSAIDLSSKFLHYKPDISVLTGIAWDHINVFPTYESYQDTFIKYLKSMDKDSWLYAFDETETRDLVEAHAKCHYEYYSAFKSVDKHLAFKGKNYRLKIFGTHNLANLTAAYHVCKQLNVPEDKIFESFENFETPDKRMNVLFEDANRLIIKDFAHAPSKVKATVSAVSEANPDKKLFVLLELHTYSSLNKAFLPFYKDSLGSSHEALVMYNPKTLEIKRMEALDPQLVETNFGHPNLKVETENYVIETWLKEIIAQDSYVLLIMTSGHLGGLVLDNMLPE